jgi:hypothetical protein
MQRNAEVSKANFLRYLQLTRLAKPTHDRRLYRSITSKNVRRIVEFGLRDGQRAANMISLALRNVSDKPLRYTGIDLFESRPGDNSFSLKDAHQLLHSHGHKVRFVPGEPAAALARCVNELRGTDLIVVSSQISSTELEAAWHFLPRMLHKDSQVWIEESEGSFRVLTPVDLRQSVQKGARKAA